MDIPLIKAHTGDINFQVALLTSLSLSEMDRSIISDCEPHQSDLNHTTCENYTWGFEISKEMVITKQVKDCSYNEVVPQKCPWHQELATFLIPYNSPKWWAEWADQWYLAITMAALYPKDFGHIRGVSSRKDCQLQRSFHELLTWWIHAQNEVDEHLHTHSARNAAV